MKNIAIAIGALAGASAQSEPYNGMCTTMGFGTSATSDGSTMITHTADCKDCDFRLDKTPPANHDLDLNPNRPVYRYRRQYPRLVAEERGSTWQPTNLESEFSSDWSSKEYIDSQIVGYIPQVSHTYGLFESLFAIMNDQQVAIGESTSSARFGENAVPRECPTCPGPLVDVAAISLVALERCKTALCAVEMMGELATKYGYYGAETEEGDRGEALTVSDPTSVYMMHLSPDPTATTAVWVARRVPDNHVTAAANQFVIRGINKDTDLYSKNIFQVAVDAGVAAYDADGNLDFLKSYGVDSQPGPGLLRKSEYTTDRIWRIYSLLAPSKNFHRKTDCYGSDFPFSVEVEFPVTPQFVMNINRDHYSGTELDLTKGFASGPYSNPVRYDPGNGWPDESYAHNENNITEWERSHGAFPRAIGIMRTSWHFVAQLRSDLPTEVGAVLHYAQHQPVTSVYTPLYGSISEVPAPFTRGSLYSFSDDSMFWKFCSVGNYAQLAWKYIFPDIEAVQMELEENFFKERGQIDATAKSILEADGRDAAVKYLTEYSNTAANDVFDEYKGLFAHVLGKFHDGAISRPETNVYDASEYFYPQWWLKQSDFFTNVLGDNGWSLEGIKVSLSHVFSPEVADNISNKFLGHGVGLGVKSSKFLNLDSSLVIAFMAGGVTVVLVAIFVRVSMGLRTSGYTKISDN